MVTSTLVFNSIMSLLAGFFIYLALSPKREDSSVGKRIIRDLKSKERETASVEELNIANKMMADLSSRIRRPTDETKTRLLKSGKIYPSMEVYLMRRVLNSFAFASCAFMVLYALHIDWTGMIIFTIAGLVYGFGEPDRTINRKINVRAKKLRLEMGYVLEQFNFLLEASQNVDESLSECSNIGDFGAVLGQIAYYRSLKEPSEKAIALGTEDVPAFPEFDQFLALLRAKMIENEDISKALQTMAFALRDKFTNEIKAISGRARLWAMIYMVIFCISGTMAVILMPLTQMLFGGM